MDRIIAMPFEYIEAWLNGQNELLWRREDELMLSAMKGDYVALQQQFPNREIHKISPGSLDFYKSLDFELLEERNGYCFVSKICEKLPLSDQIHAAVSKASSVSESLNENLEHQR